MWFVNKETKVEHEISDPMFIQILSKDSNFEQLDKEMKKPTEEKVKRR